MDAGQILDKSQPITGQGISIAPLQPIPVDLIRENLRQRSIRPAAGNAG